MIFRLITVAWVALVLFAAATAASAALQRSNACGVTQKPVSALQARVERQERSLYGSLVHAFADPFSAD